MKHVQQSPSTLQSCPSEEFNFSKAALSFSHGLTKDHVFTGLRYILQTIGECMRVSSNTVIVDFDVGRLTFGTNKTHFHFNSKLRSLVSSTDDLDAFTEMTSISAASSASTKPAVDVYPHESVSQVSASRSRAPSAQAPPPVAATTRSPASEVSSKRSQSETPILPGKLRQELAYRQAMARHMAEMEVRAKEALAAKKQWTDQLQSWKHGDVMDSEKRKRIKSENSSYLLAQIKANEAKRKDARRTFVESASCHNFPEFTELETAPKKGSSGSDIRRELDLQIQTEKALKSISKLREMELNDQLNAMNRKALAEEQQRDRERQFQNRNSLNQSWDRDIRLKQCWKAIDHFDMTNKALDSFPVPLSTRRPSTGSARRAPINASSARPSRV